MSSLQSWTPRPSNATGIEREDTFAFHMERTAVINRSLPTVLAFGGWTLIMLSQAYAARTVFQRTNQPGSRRALALHWVMSLIQAYAILHPAVLAANVRAVGLGLLALSLALLWWSIKHTRGAGLGIARRIAEPYRANRTLPRDSPSVLCVVHPELGQHAISFRLVAHGSDTGCNGGRISCGCACGGA
jgi:hypothetical protein